MQKIPTYPFRLSKDAAICCLSLLLCTITIYAQEDKPPADTSIRYQITNEPVIEENQQPPASEEEEMDEEKRTDYFLKRNDFAGNLDTIVFRTIPGDVVKNLQEDPNFWYANSLKKEKKKKASTIPLGERTWFQTLLWVIIIGGFAGFMILYLSGSNVGLFRKSRKVINTEEDEELATEDIFAINYQKEIDKAALAGNYRLATRLLFLRLLKNLSQRNIIQYKQDKTNMDYLVQLNATAYYNDFLRIARNYEYSWYGHFDVNEDAYRIIKNDFDKFEHKW